MRITKILNNNAVVVLDGQEEKIAIGSGVAFQKRKNDVVNAQKIEKLFVMNGNERLQQLLKRIPEEHFLISEEIIRYTECYFHMKLDEHIRLVLADHISFAIEREKKGIHLANMLLPEIKILFKKEYEVGLWAIAHIKDKLNIEMPLDEAGFIALHIHIMKTKGSELHETIRQTSLLKQLIQTIKDYLNIVIKEDDIAYERLITHLRFSLQRSKNYYEFRVMDDEIFEMIKRKLPYSYSCAQMVANQLATLQDIHLPREELSYITLHIERLRNC